MVKAILFDLDGTLADTAKDLVCALNRCLAQKGLPQKSFAETRILASHGANALIEFGAGIAKNHPEHAQWRQCFLAEYERGIANETVLFNGINELIAHLRQRNIIWGIVTNKPKIYTHLLLPELHFIVPPAVVVSGDTTGESKPSVKPMLHACSHINCMPKDCWYVGDTIGDMQAGRSSGMKTVLANWGYIEDGVDTASWPIDIIINTPLELLLHLDQIND